MPENKNDAPAFNLEQFTEEELNEYIKASVENIGFDSEGFFHFIDHTLATQIKPPSDPRNSKKEKHYNKGKNLLYYFSGTALTAIGTGIAAVFVNPLLSAPGGLAMASILSAPLIVDRVNNRKNASKQIEATHEVSDETFDLYAHVIQLLQPKILHWLEESYKIKVTEEDALVMAQYMIRAHERVAFTTTSSDRKYLVRRINNTWRVECWDTVRNRYIKLATVGTMSTLPNAAFQPDLTTLQKHKPETETETVFTQKIKLLERHKLSTEAQYRLTAVKNEAAKIVAATTVLIDLGETSYHDKSDTAFALLNDELDAIISEKVEQEYFNLAVSEQFVSERYRKPLQLEKNKTEQLSR